MEGSSGLKSDIKLESDFADAISEPSVTDQALNLSASTLTFTSVNNNYSSELPNTIILSSTMCE